MIATARPNRTTEYRRTISMRDMLKVKKRASGCAGAFVLATLCLPMPAQGPGPNGQGAGSSSGSAIGAVTAVQQQLSQPGPNVTPATGSNDPSFKGSIVQGKATADVLGLALDDAMQRGLRNNLGLVLQTSN